MSRLTHSATFSGWTVVALRASLPTTTSVSSKSTTLGVSSSPSALGTIAVRPVWSTHATAELVVPRSSPIGFRLTIRCPLSQGLRRKEVDWRSVVRGTCAGVRPQNIKWAGPEVSPARIGSPSPSLGRPFDLPGSDPTSPVIWLVREPTRQHRASADGKCCPRWGYPAGRGWQTPLLRYVPFLTIPLLYQHKRWFSRQKGPHSTPLLRGVCGNRIRAACPGSPARSR